MGKPGFPTPVAREARAGCGLPNPPRREGDGETRFPHARCARGASRLRPPEPSPEGGEWGNPVSPRPLRGRCEQAAASRTLPGGRVMGKPGFPISQPLLGAASTPTGRGMGKPGFPVFSPQSVLTGDGQYTSDGGSEGCQAERWATTGRPVGSRSSKSAVVAGPPAARYAAWRGLAGLAGA